MSALRSGYTTGSCAAAAAKAAVLLLAEGRVAERVEIVLPGGTRIALPLAYVRPAAGGAEAAVVKDAGDDPDVTNGALVTATVAWTDGNGLEFAAGEGVGTVTKPGLATPPGEPAINPVPRRMIAQAVREVTPRASGSRSRSPAAPSSPKRPSTRGSASSGGSRSWAPRVLSAPSVVRRCGSRSGAALTWPRRRASGHRSSSPATSASGRRGRCSRSRTSRLSRWETSGASSSTRRSGALSRTC